MGSFSGLVNYVRKTFEIDLELSLAFCVGVRARSALCPPRPQLSSIMLLSRLTRVDVCVWQTRLIRDETQLDAFLRSFAVVEPAAVPVSSITTGWQR